RLVVAEEVARGELEILEVDGGLPLLRGAVTGLEAFEQLLEQVAIAGGDGVERRLLDAPARLLVRGGAVAAGREVAQVEQPIRLAAAVEESEQARRVRPLRLGRGRVVGQATRRLGELRDSQVERRGLAELERER